MRLLIISKDAWCKSNSFGNSYSNFFNGVPNVEIANILLGDGEPDDVNYITSTFQISESDIIKSFFKRRYRLIGHKLSSNKKEKIDLSHDDRSSNSAYSILLNFGKKHHWQLLFWAREIAWRFGKINYPELYSFITDFKPDLLFLPYDYVFFTNRIALELRERFDLPMVSEFGMDHYSFKRISFSPLFWIDRIFKRSSIRKVVKHSSFMFVISNNLKLEFENSFHKECKILYKRVDLERHPVLYEGRFDNPQFLFTGNIYANRWKSLAMLARILENNNYGHLDIYTSTKVNKKMNRALNIPGFSSVHPPVSFEEVLSLQAKADVLVHVESFDAYNKSLVKCAISTKIMDYLSAGRCILGIGPLDVASIDFLVNSNAALIATDDKSLSDIVRKIQDSPDVLVDYANRGIKYCEENMNVNMLREDFYNALKKAVDEYQ